VLVVHFVRPADGFYINIIPIAQNLKALVDDDVVHQEISQAVYGNAGSNPKTKIVVYASGYETICAGHSKYEEEGIVFFKKTFMALMVISVQDPQESVHHVLVGEPSHELHKKEGGDYDNSVPKHGGRSLGKEQHKGKKVR
jgi:hypothetical protein